MLRNTVIISTNKGWVGETRHELADFIPMVLTFRKWKWRKGEILEIWGKKEVVVWVSAWDRKQPAQLDVGHSLAWKGLVKEGTIGGTPRWAALGPHLCGHLCEWCLCSVNRTTCVAEGSNLQKNTELYSPQVDDKEENYIPILLLWKWNFPPGLNCQLLFSLSTAVFSIPTDQKPSPALHPLPNNTPTAQCCTTLGGAIHARSNGDPAPYLTAALRV